MPSSPSKNTLLSPIAGPSKPSAAARKMADIFNEALGGDLATTDNTVVKAVETATSRKGKEVQRKTARTQPSNSKYDQMTSSKREDVLRLLSGFYKSLTDFAQSNNLNPAEVNRFALGSDLGGSRMNTWKLFQLLSGLARNGCKFSNCLLKYAILNI